MAVTIEEYDQYTTTVSGIVTTTLGGAATTPGYWLLLFQGQSADQLSALGPDPGARTGWPAGSWHLLAQVDAGDGLPKWRVWAAKIPNDPPAKVILNSAGPDYHQHLYVLSGVRDSDDADAVFSAGSKASAAGATGQQVPLYAPEASGLLIGAWLSGAVANYTLPVTARTEVDGTVSTSRAGEQTVSASGPSTRTGTSSVAAPWAAVSVVARAAGGPMTFPDSPLAVRTELALGANPDQDPSTWAGLWTDITADVYARQPITITRGRGDEASTVQPSTMALELNNAAGKYTRLNPLSPYYGQLSKNTPIRCWVDPGSGMDLRYTGFVSEWPPRQQGGDVDQAMPIAAAGIMRRLNQGSVLNSAMARWVPTRPFVAYWPLETDTSSGLLGGHAMTVAGTVTFGSGGPPGSAGAMSTADNGKTYAPVVGMADNGGWIVAWWVEVPDGFDSATQQGILVDWQTPGMTYSRWLAYAAPGGGGAMVVGGYDENGNVITAAGSTNLAGLGPTLISVRCAQNGANIEITVYLGSTIADAFVSAADTAKPITSISVNGYLGSTDPIEGSLSHLMVGDGDPDRLQDQFVSTNHAAIGYAGETAADRISRVAAEEGVSIAVVGDDGTSEQMGPQPVATFLSLLRDCEAADGGVLYEQRNGRLAYQCRSGRYNQTPSLVLDYASGHVAPPLEPTDDDQRTRNDWSVSRDGGGTARVTNDAHAAVVGRYADSTSLNISGDGRLADQAGWRVHLGTEDGLRYPTIAANLNGRPELIPGWLGMDVGKAAQLTSPAADLAAGTVDLIGEGYGETIDLVDWRASLNCSPGAPWRITVRDSDHRDTAGSQLAAAAATPAAATSVTEDFEDTTYTVTITGGGNLPWARDNTTAHGGSWSLRSGAITDNQTSDAIVTVPAGMDAAVFWYRVSSEATFDFLRVLVDGVEQFAFSGEVGWRRGAVTVTGASTVTFRYSKDAFTAAGSDAAWIDDLAFTTTETLSVTTTLGPVWTTTAADFPFDVWLGGEQVTVTGITGTGTTQTFTVIRSVNGIAKSHDAGTAVRLYDQTYRAL